MILAPLWILTLLTPFFSMVGEKAALEIKKERARDKKKAKELERKREALKKLEEALNKAEATRLKRVQEEFARAEKSIAVKRDLKARIGALRVELDENPFQGCS